MTKTKSTKRALITSVLSLIVCITMLIGSTYAWFTDTAVSSGNKIQAGTLKIDLEVLENGKWNSVKDSHKAIFDYDRWEPGYTDVKVLRVTNEGTLALKWYAKLVSKTKMSILADVIDVYVKDGATEYPASKSLDGYKRVGTLAEFINNVSETTHGVLTEGKSATLGLAFKMQESAGNEYQGLTLGEFDIQILATQYTYESDFFDIYYDENANFFSKWDGSVNTGWYNDSEKTFIITSAADFAGLAKLVNEGNTFKGKTVKLGADIDLDNISWTPIGTAKNNFGGTFDGNGYVIANLSVTGTEGVGLFGFAGNAASIYNVNIVNATVEGNHYVGTVLGYGYLSANSLAGCTVENATVFATPDSNNDNGDKAGVIAGMAINGNIYNNKAINSSVYAYRDFGGIVGCAQAENRSINVYDNTIENVTLTYIYCDNYADGKENQNMGDHVGRENPTSGKTVTVNDNTGTAVKTASEAIIAATNDDLSAAVKSDVSTVVLKDGNYSLPSLANETGVVLVGSKDTVIGGDNVSTGFGSSNFGKDTTIKNITFSGSSNGVRYSYAKGGTTTFENCTFKGESTYGFHIDQSNGATFIFNNCTFIGFNAFAGDLVSVTFNECTFLSNGYYGHTNIWSVGNFNNCVFGDNTSIGVRGSGKLFIDGVEESYHHEYIGSASSLVSFARSVNEEKDSWSGQKVLLVADIDLSGIDWEPIGQTGATEFKGTFDGQGHTISNLSVDSSDETGAHYSSGLFGWVENAFVTIKNVNVDGATVTGHHNCAVIVGYTYANIENCHVKNASVVCTHATDDACGDKAGVIVGYAGPSDPAAGDMDVTNCSASDCTVSAGRDGGQLIGAGYTGCFNGTNTATNVVVDATEGCTHENAGKNISNELIGRVMGE